MRTRLRVRRQESRNAAFSGVTSFYRSPYMDNNHVPFNTPDRYIAIFLLERGKARGGVAIASPNEIPRQARVGWENT